jgi:hypothetical protein
LNSINSKVSPISQVESLACEDSLERK